MKRRKKVDNIDAIVFPDSKVEYADCNQIRNKNCWLDSWRTNYGYHELDNAVKYCICENPLDKIIIC